jgi:photosystem II stability/assembly factor-like uncharacterized protein
VLVVLLALASTAFAQAVKVDTDVLGGLEARSIGPATMSGRIAAVEGVVGDRLTLYAGAAGGGLWKSSDGGVRFKPIFDKYNQSIGAIAVDPSNPKTLWVGTGESWVRNSVSVGDGVYRSTDGGDNWTRLGLADTERISRIVISPRDGKTVFVCALGHVFDDHPERGVFRTKDAGRTWEKVLYVASDTGCGDLAMDPQDPNILYAGMWQVRRRPDFFTSGGPRSGFFKSTDGGTTWQPMKKGLPEGDLGRIAIAVAPSKPSLVYATVEAKKTAFYKSEDRGETWAEMTSAQAVAVRPFYFSRLVVDPVDPNRLYKMGLFAAMSEDGGRTFLTLGLSATGAGYHSDVHDIWINPQHPADLVIGTDGGVFVSHDRGNAWRFVGTLPVSQFYHVSVDMAWPFNVYGGLQDNMTWYGPSRRAGGLGNRNWQGITNGDGFWVFVDPTDADVIYAEIQGGNLSRVRRSTFESKDIKPQPREGEPRFRFNWNTPIHMSRVNPGVIYYGAQFLFRSKDKGESWERISPDLTTNDPARQRQDDSGGLSPENSSAENNCTIFAIGESPKSADVIWVGTDDGHVQVTRNGGKTWTNVTPNVRGVPKNTWVSSVEPGHFDEAVAYVTFDGHMTGDMTPYVFRTTDFGKTWENLSPAGLKPRPTGDSAAPAGTPVGQGFSLADGDLRGYAHVVKEDPVDRDLLFVGTEFGLFVSVDGGRQWAQFTSRLPNVAVRDLAIHPRDDALVIATHGRGLYVVDDLTPLRSLTPQVLESDAAFLATRPSTMVMPVMDPSFTGDNEFVGESPGESAFVTYYLKKRHILGDLRLEVYDPAGALVVALPGGKRRGINRVEIPLRSKPPKVAPGLGMVMSVAALYGPRILEGTYTVKLIRSDQVLESEVRLVPDPRSPHSAADRAAQRLAALRLFGMVERLAAIVQGLIDVGTRANARASALPAGDALTKRLQAFAAGVEEQRASLVATKQFEGISGEEKLREELGMLYGTVNGYEGRPTQSQLTRAAVLEKRLADAQARYDRTTGADLDTLNKLLAARKMGGLGSGR